MGVRVLRIVRQTETRVFTSTTSVRETATTTGEAAASSSTDSVSSGADAEASSAAVTDANSSASDSPVITTAPVVPTTIVSDDSTSTTVAPVEGVPVVTAIPFSCDPDDIGKNVDQVVGGIRVGYDILCNTGLVSSDRIGYPINVESATSCAAQCSLINARGAAAGTTDICQSAVFTPYTNGTRGGDCEIFSAAEAGSVTTSPTPGSITIVHTGTFANGNECAALNATSVSIDTSSIVASITAGGVSISTPGLVTQSAGGGVSALTVSANSTDASGYVHWSIFEYYASSTNWFAVYETSWACSATITRTLEQPATVVIEGSTITSVIITTIIGNGYTTIISGDSTTTFRGNGGVGGGPTFVPASTTSGEAGFTTFFSTAVEASTGTDGIVTPTPAPSIGGQGNVTVEFSTATFFSSGTAGVIPPSSPVSLDASVSSAPAVETIVSSTAITLTISGANSTIFSVGTDGVITPSETPNVETIVSSGAVTLTISGSDATATSTGTGGVISPSSSTSTTEEEWDESSAYGPPQPKTSTLVVASSSVLTITSTNSVGVETPTVVTAVSSETVVVVISNTTITGNGSTAVSTSTATLNSTGSRGIIPPPLITEVVESIAGSGNITITFATATANSSFAEGIIPPESTLVVTETVNSTLPVPTPTGNITNEGSGNFSTAFTTAFVSSTLISGVIPPASVNSTSFESLSTGTDNRFGSISRSSSTRTSNSTSASGVITPSSNSSIAIVTPPVNTTLVLTVPLSTGFTSTVELPPVNSSVPVTSAPTPTPTPSTNSSSIPSESLSTTSDNRFGSFSRSSSVAVNTTFTLTLPVSTGTTTVEIPVMNSTISRNRITPFTEVSASTLVVTATTNITLSLPTGNITLIPPTTRPFDDTTAPLPTPTGNITTESLVSINYSTVPSFSTGNLSTILPPTTPTSNITIVIETPPVPVNSTTAPPASITIPPVSLNFTLSLPVQNSTSPGPGPSFGTDDRFGSISRSMLLSTGIITSSNATTTPPPFPTGNSTLPSGPTAPTTEACPSPTEFSFITREVIITTYTVETVPVVASTCISSDAAPTGLNGTLTSAGNIGNATLPTDVAVLPSVVESLAAAVDSLTASDATPTSSGSAAAVASDILSAVSSVVSEAAATPLSRFRRSGTLATQEQINAACNDTGNLVLSPTLDIQPSADSEGWFLSLTDDTVQVASVDTDNGTIVRFSSAFTGHPVQLSQPVTLCPGTQYVLSGLTRQDSTYSGCTVQFKIGNDAVFTADSQTDWSTRTERFTAGPGAEGASQDLNLVLNCAGFDGVPAGTDNDGRMNGYVGPVSVTAEQFRH